MSEAIEVRGLIETGILRVQDDAVKVSRSKADKLAWIIANQDDSYNQDIIQEDDSVKVERVKGPVATLLQGRNIANQADLDTLPVTTYRALLALEAAKAGTMDRMELQSQTEARNKVDVVRAIRNMAQVRKVLGIIAEDEANAATHGPIALAIMQIENSLYAKVQTVLTEHDEINIVEARPERKETKKVASRSLRSKKRVA